MDNETIKRRIRELCQSPQPERKAEFFQNMKDQGLLNKHPFRLSQGEFLAGQIVYIEKRIWLLSALKQGRQWKENGIPPLTQKHI